MSTQVDNRFLQPRILIRGQRLLSSLLAPQNWGGGFSRRTTMTCTTIQPLLEAFAGHDLSPLTRWRIRRHLTQCPACTAELAEINALTARVRDWQNVPAPAGLEARIAARLPAAAPVPARPPLRRAAVGLAGLAAALAAAFWLVPGQPGRPTVAFAEVEQAMQNVQTVSWHSTMLINDKSSDKSKQATVTYTNWLRRSPAAIAATDYIITSPNRVSKSTGEFPVRALQSDQGFLTLSKKECLIMPVHKPFSEAVTRRIKELTQLPQSTIALGPLPEQVKTTVTNFHQENVVVGGQKQIRFERDIEKTWLTSSRKNAYRLAHVVTWASADSHRVTRIEARILKDSILGTVSSRYLLIEDCFQYNQPPLKGVFDWSIPAGVEVVRLSPAGVEVVRPVPDIIKK